MIANTPPAPATAPVPAPTRVPLTIAQKTRLAFECLPLITLSLLDAGYLTVLRPLVGPPPPVLLLVMAVSLLLYGYTAFTSSRDLAAGVALVQEDVLESFGRSGRRRRRSFGIFKRLGRLWMTSGVLLPGRMGHRHRITYSPSSRIAWRLEPLD